jgi:phasin family protein
MELALTASQPSALPFVKAIPDFQQFFALPQANIEALTQANTALAKGIEEIGKHIATLIEVECERTAAAAKAAMAVRTLQDAIALNTDYAKVSLEQLVANTTALRELGVKVAQDAAAPITARVTVGVEAVGKSVNPAAAVDKHAKSAA